MGFREDLEFILGAAPESRRTLMFSATVSKPIAQLGGTLPARCRASQHHQQPRTAWRHHLYRPPLSPPHERENAIINVLRLHEAEKAILFCSTREAVKRLTSRPCQPWLCDRVPLR